MQSDSPSRPFVAILGPTASGKSGLALDIARDRGGEIVNCDSVQVYRGFGIGSAKVSAEVRREIPHHLIDICDAGETFSAGDFAKQGRRALGDISSRGKLPIVAGGTGFYLRALLHGLFSGPGRRPELRERLQTRESVKLHRILGRLDAVAAARIHPNDRNKLIRAVEVCLSAHQPMSALHQRGSDPLTGYRPLLLMLDPPRAELYYRINQRCREMFETGLLEEVESLLCRGVSESSQPMRAVGYREAVQVLRGSLSLEDAIGAAQQATRNYAKRQWTWFRKEKEIQTISGFGDDPAIRREAAARVTNFLAEFSK